MAIKYTFRDAPITIKNAKIANPQKIGEAVAAIKDRRPDNVVAAARTNKALHPHFEWDDKVCGVAYRREQARELVALLVEVDKKAEGGVRRAFWSVSTDEGTSYRTASEVMDSADFQKALLEAADREVEALERRLRDVADVCSLLKPVRSKIREHISRLNESRPSA